MNEDKEIRVETEQQIHMGKLFASRVWSVASSISWPLPATSLLKHTSMGVNDLDINQGEITRVHYFVCMFAFLLKWMKEN